MVASALAHLWCLGSQFYLDDKPAILGGEVLRNGRFWETKLNAWTNFGYVIQHRLFGLSAVGFHAVNWLLHTAVACVLFGFGREFIRDRWPAGVALFGALLFAVHPLGSEIPNYVRTQDLAWVTLFSLLAAWALLHFLLDGGWLQLAACGVLIVGATLSKGPGLFHALMMSGAVGLAFMPPRGWEMLKSTPWPSAAGVAVLITGLWISGLLGVGFSQLQKWSEPRMVGHGYPVARVFWEFSWRGVFPVGLSADHHIAEPLIPPGANFWNIPDRVAILAAVGFLGKEGDNSGIAIRN